jgi:predicted component of type VI protein secretion system
MVNMDEQRIREIIREELAAHEERLKGEPVVIALSDENKGVLFHILKEINQKTCRSPLVL